MSPVPVAEEQFEQRIGRRGFELRAAAGGMLKLSGYASVFDVEYDVFAWRETIAPGAFDETLASRPDVQLLINHGAGGSGMPLARTLSGTMRLVADSVGLKVDADLDPEDLDVQSLQRKAARGDIDAMSFAFIALESEWSDDFSRRRITRVSIDRGDVAVCNQGANPASSFDVRSHAMAVASRAGGPARMVTAAGYSPGMSSAELEARLLLLRAGRR